MESSRCLYWRTSLLFLRESDLILPSASIIIFHTSQWWVTLSVSLKHPLSKIHGQAWEVLHLGLTTTPIEESRELYPRHILTMTLPWLLIRDLGRSRLKQTTSLTHLAYRGRIWKRCTSMWSRTPQFLRLLTLWDLANMKWNSGGVYPKIRCGTRLVPNTVSREVQN